MAATIEIRIKDCGVKKNKGQGWNAWIRSTDNRVYYSKFCQDEEEGKAAIGNLKSGDKIFLKFTVKNGFNNFQSYQTNNIPSDTEKKPVEQKKEHPAKTEHDKHREEEIQKMKAVEKELIKEEQAKEKALNDFCIEHYTAAIDMAKEIVKSAKIDETDPLFVPVVTVILDKIATPKVYLKKEARQS